MVRSCIGIGLTAAVITAVAGCGSSSGLPGEGNGIDVASRESAILKDVPYGGGSDTDLPANTIILTFDDGPDGPPNVATADMTLAIAQYLHDEGIHAVFFMNGKRFLNQPQVAGCQLSGDHANPNFRHYDESLLDTVVQLGHRIANHTQDHCNVGGVVSGVDNQVFVGQELRLTQAILDRHALDGPYLFRPPYGSWSVTDGQRARADVCLDKLEGPVNWDIDAGDWSCWAPQGFDGLGRPIPNRNVDGCLQGYVNQINARRNRNGIVLHHDRPEYTVDVADYYAAAGNYAPRTIPLLNDGVLYPSNELGLIRAEVRYLKALGYHFGRIEDLYPGNRVRNWSKCGDYSDWDAGFGSKAGYYQSFQLADVDGDGLADACGRGAGGVLCARNMGNGQFEGHALWLGSNYLDAQGWLAEQYGTTLQFADLNGDGRADVCGRGIDGMVCAASNGAGFEAAAVISTWPDFSDAVGWAGGESYYRSLHLVDVNGDGLADACARASVGIVCAINTSGLSADHALHFAQASVWMGQDFTDAAGWFTPRYGATVQFADIDGDGRADVCGRGWAGMRCALGLANGGFGPSAWWSAGPDFADADPNANGWQSPVYYRSIRLVDINGDGKADACGRTANGIVCALSTGTSFQSYHLMRYPELTEGPPVASSGNDYTDALGWGLDQYASTIQFGLLDGDSLPDVCGRGGRGLFCALTRP